jgi:hypothetical protein
MAGKATISRQDLAAYLSVLVLIASSPWMSSNFTLKILIVL